MNPVAGAAILVLVGAMGVSWIARRLLLRLLERNYPQQFAELGHPSTKKLTSVHPRHHDMQIGFWRYLWRGEAFRLGNPAVSALAAAAVIADVVMGIAFAVLVWAAFA